MGVYSEKQRLYREYLQETGKVAGKGGAANSKSVRVAADYYINSADTKWKNIWLQDDNTLEGFLIIGTGVECHPEADRSIIHAFVRPEARGLGLMENRVCRYVNEHPGVYCMRIPKHDGDAAGFFRHVFETKLKYQEASLSEWEDGGGGYIYLAYKPR